MAVGAPSRPVPHGPRSPTLSDAGMILPQESRFERSLSPLPYIERPPSPPILQTDPSHVKLTAAPQSRRRPSHHAKSPPLSAQSSRSTLRTMGDAAAIARSAPTRDDALASSPTINNGLTSPAHSRWNPHNQRRLSAASSSVHSDDLDNWPGFDSHGTFDDSGVDLEDQEKRDQFSADMDVGDDLGNDPWPNDRNSGSDDDDDPYSSAALSRRAEIILANAKKRLNVCVTTINTNDWTSTNNYRSWKETSEVQESHSSSLRPSTLRATFPTSRSTYPQVENAIDACTLESAQSLRASTPTDPLHFHRTAAQATRGVRVRLLYRFPLCLTIHRGLRSTSERQARSATQRILGHQRAMVTAAFQSRSRAVLRSSATLAILGAQMRKRP